MWSLLGPGLAGPGHIELASRTVYLDSDSLLGSREQILDGALEPHRALATFGVAAHEVLHAKLWVMQRDIELADGQDEHGRQLAVDRRLLEEPRMEATGVREFPETSRRGVFIRRALASAVVEVLLPRFIEAIMLEALANQTVSRELCGRSIVYLQGRSHYGVCDPARLGPLPGLWKRVLGGEDMAGLDELFARLIWAPDGDNGALDRYASEYREIIGSPPPPPPGADGQPGQGGAAGGRSDECASNEAATQGSDGEQPTPQSLGDALEQAANSPSATPDPTSRGT